MDVKTHLAIDPALCGSAVELDIDRSTVQMETIARMAADERGLVHGGFVFGMADYAAMLAVNDPFVVLGSAETKFLAPCRVGDILEAQASVSEKKGRKHVVDVSVRNEEREVFAGRFTCFITEGHVFDR